MGAERGGGGGGWKHFERYTSHHLYTPSRTPRATRQRRIFTFRARKIALRNARTRRADVSLEEAIMAMKAGELVYIETDIVAQVILDISDVHFVLPFLYACAAHVIVVRAFALQARQRLRRTPLQAVAAALLGNLALPFVAPAPDPVGFPVRDPVPGLSLPSADGGDGRVALAFDQGRTVPATKTLRLCSLSMRGNKPAAARESTRVTPRWLGRKKLHR